MSRRVVCTGGLVAMALACGKPGAVVVKDPVSEPGEVPSTTREVPSTTREVPSASRDEAIEEITKALLSPPPFMDSDVKEVTPEEEDRARETVAAFIDAHADAVQRVEYMVDILEADSVTTVADAYAHYDEDQKERSAIEVDASGQKPWRFVVIVSHAYNTSEDWGWFTAEVSGSCAKAAVPLVWSDVPGDRYVEVQRDQKPVARIDLRPIIEDYAIGYVVAMEGKEPEFLAHSMTFDVLQQAGNYFGTTIDLVPL